MRDLVRYGLRGLLTRRFRLALATVVAAAALLIPATAMAANGGDPDQGLPPCDTQSTSQHNVLNMYDPGNGAYMGQAYLVYSAGCETEWVTVHYTAGYSPSPSVWMQNQSGTDLYGANYDSGVTWTYQLTNMRYQTACGGVQMYTMAGAYVNWNYLGCY
jgi:hypothetical protein